MKALKSLMCFVALFAMMSCDNDDPIIKSVIEYYNCFNLVENQPANTSATFNTFFCVNNKRLFNFTGNSINRTVSCTLGAAFTQVLINVVVL